MRVGFGIGISFPQLGKVGIVGEVSPIGEDALLWDDGGSVLWGDNSIIPITSKDNLLWMDGTDMLWGDGTDILCGGDN